MGNTLKPGGQGADFASSMAKAMEDALNVLLVAEGRPPVDTTDSDETRDRRIMFLAIAQGVVNHLAANEDAFTVRRDDGTLRLEHNIRIATNP